MKILVVDDQSENRYFLSTLLGAMGHEVETGANGQEALAKLHAAPYDMVISDILMPVMDGFQLCRTVRQEEALKRILFIFYTATYVEDEDEVFALRLGADRFLRKPMEPELFVQEVQALILQAKNRQEEGEKPEDDDKEVLKLYNARLIKKLEDKMLRLEKEMAERNRLSIAIHQASEAVLITDQEGKVEYVNPAFGQITGYPPDEIIGEVPSILKGKPTEESFYRSLWKTLRQGGIWRGHLTDRGKSGGTIQWTATVSPLRDPAGQVTGYAAILRDVTMEEQLKASLVQSQKMESIGTLASGIAHDFNNILSAIIGNAEMGLYSPLPPDHVVRQHLEQILQAGERASGLVRQILTFSRRREPEMTLVSLTAVIKEALRLLRASIPTTIDIQMRLPDHSSLLIADIGQIHQIIMNLCTNAAQAMKSSGGVLTICLDESKSWPAHYQDTEHGRRTGPCLHLSVTDTGSGIPKEIQEKIFEPYFTTKPLGKGTGLGLAVVHGIVSSLNGVVFVESEEAKGSTFHIYLPCTDMDEKPADEESAAIPRGSERILFVDDEVILAETGSCILRHLGYAVTTATSIHEALRVFRENPNFFDLAITDLTMPEMTGDKLAMEMLSVRADLPIILCTGYSDPSVEEEARKIGIREFAPKPLSTRLLATKIRSVLDSGKTWAVQA